MKLTAQIVIRRPALTIPQLSSVLVVALLLGGWALRTLNPESIGLFHDDGIYTVVAKSLAEGKGYRIISLPTEPAQTKYPFVYSYLLSWLWYLYPDFPANVILLKSLNVLALVTVFFLGFIFYRRSTQSIAPGEGLLFGLLVCINPAVFFFIDLAVSDLLFLAMILVALISYERLMGAGSKPGGTLLYAGIVALACLTRPLGLALVLAVGSRLLAMGQLRQLGVFIMGLLVFLSPWGLWLAQSGGGVSNPLLHYYLSHDTIVLMIDLIRSDPGKLLEILWGNLRYLVGFVDFAFLSRIVPGLTAVFFFAVAMGVGGLLRGESKFLVWFVIYYSGLLLTWPFASLRYLLPLIPVLCLCFFNGLRSIDSLIRERVKSSLKQRVLSGLVYLPLAIVLLLNFAWLARTTAPNQAGFTRVMYGLPASYSWNGFAETFDWVRSHTDPSAIIATAYDPMYYLYTGRQAVRPGLHKPETYFYPYGEAVPDVGSVNEIKPHLRNLRVSYLIVDPLDGYTEREATLRLIEGLLSSYGGRARLVFTSSDGKHRVYFLNES